MDAFFTHQKVLMSLLLFRAIAGILAVSKNNLVIIISLNLI